MKNEIINGLLLIFELISVPLIANLNDVCEKICQFIQKKIKYIVFNFDLRQTTTHD